MHKAVITFLSISQIAKAGKLQQKARQEGQYRLRMWTTWTVATSGKSMQLYCMTGEYCMSA